MAYVMYALYTLYIYYSAGWSPRYPKPQHSKVTIRTQTQQNSSTKVEATSKCEWRIGIGKATMEYDDFCISLHISPHS
jgi:hypothetical protein